MSGLLRRPRPDAREMERDNIAMRVIQGIGRSSAIETARIGRQSLDKAGRLSEEEAHCASGILSPHPL
jgi:hypothetical protein